MGDSLSRKEVSLLLKKSERTITRLAASGELPRNADGTFDSDELEEYLKAKATIEREDDEREEKRETAAFEALSSAYQRTLQSNEKLMQVIIEQTKTTLDSLTTANANLLARDEKREDTHVQLMSALGELLENRDERKARLIEAKAKGEQLGKLGDTAALVLPKLLAQASGKEELLEFVTHLSEEEKEQIPLLAEAFQDPRAKLGFKKLMLKMGLGVKKEGAVSDGT